MHGGVEWFNKKDQQWPAGAIWVISGAGRQGLTKFDKHGLKSYFIILLYNSNNISICQSGRPLGMVVIVVKQFLQNVFKQKLKPSSDIFQDRDLYFFKCWQ